MDTASTRSILGLCSANTTDTGSISGFDIADSDTLVVLQVYDGVRCFGYCLNLNYFGILHCLL